MLPQPTRRDRVRTIPLRHQRPRRLIPKTSEEAVGGSQIFSLLFDFLRLNVLDGTWLECVSKAAIPYIKIYTPNC